MLAAGATLVGINNRDLRTFKIDLDHTLRLRDRVPPGVVLVAESGIHTRADVERLQAGGVDAINAGEEFLRDECAVVGIARFEAVVAGSAIIDGKFLAEVGEQFRAAATGAFGVAHDLAELVAGDLLFMVIGHFVDEVRLLCGVTGGKEQQAIAREAVATGAAGFLIVAFDVFGQVVVDDPADVGLVDAHAEGDGRADDPHLVTEE